MYKIVEKIKGEVSDLPSNNKDYNIGEFTKKYMIENTSKTLPSLISRLISKNVITRQSLSICQSIQAHRANIYNQTTRGQAVKLYHRFGSKELISLLHGYLCSYQELPRVRTSVAKYVGQKDYTAW